MSRHGRKVPVGFYRKFAQNVCILANERTSTGTGRVISVLEGGYSDRAITSGAMAHLCGLTPIEVSDSEVNSWWSIENLARVFFINICTDKTFTFMQVESIAKKRRGAGARPSLSPDAWFDKASSYFYQLEGQKPKAPAPVPTMSLRERKPRSVPGSPTPKLQKGAKKAEPQSETENSSADGSRPAQPATPPKKLPRVILRVGQPPSERRV